MTHSEPMAEACPVCGDSDARLLFVARDLHTLVPGDHPLLACRSCSHVWVHPQPQPNEMDAYYAGDYWSDMEWMGYIDAGVRRLIRRILREHPGGRVLDVGCAGGSKAAAMQEKGLRVVGLEPFETGCRLARERVGIEVICAYLQDADLPPESFDAVTFFDVLEHVHDPVGDLRAAHALLKPGGSIYLKTPNIRSWQARLFGRCWAVLDPPRHLHHFTPRSLRSALSAAGFSEVWSSSPPDPLAARWFEHSLILRIRDLLWARRGVTVAASDGASSEEVLEDNVCPAVPRGAKQVARKLARYVLYVPFAAENLVGSSATLLAGGRK